MRYTRDPLAKILICDMTRAGPMRLRIGVCLYYPYDMTIDINVHKECMCIYV